MPRRTLPDSTLITSPDWWTLDLVKQLKEPYKDRLKTVYNFIKPLAGIRPLGNEEFTDHDLAHSARIVERIGKLLPKSSKLNQPELYILLLAALLHDLGMWVARSEASQWLNDEDFLAHCRRYQPQEFQLVERMLNSEPRRWMGILGLQRLAAGFARAHHPERLAALLLGEAEDAHQIALQLFVDKAFLRAVAVVSEAHGWERERVLESDDLEPLEIGGVLVNLRYLAVLLRLGDLLDLGEGRVSSLLWAYLSPLNPLSEAHWRKEKTLQVVRLEPDLIRIEGTFDVDQEGVVAADAYALACDWLQWLQKEIDQCALLLPSRMDPKLRKRCTFGDLKLDYKAVRAKGLVLGGELSFNLGRDRIIALLGDEIYTQGCVFVRELLQNAMDATRVQMVRDRDREPAWQHLPREAPWLWPAEITGREDYAIEVTTRTESSAGVNYVVFSIRDQGIGMSPRQIKDYFLQVGKSYYTSTQFRKEYSHPPISRFGIGFLSCLTVADRIEITTRTRDEPAGLVLRLNSPSTNFTISKAPEAKQGTTVTLWIDPAKPRPDGWNKPPLSVEAAPTPFASEEPGTPFATAVARWGLWPEMPVVIDGFWWGPRTSRNTTYQFGMRTRRWGQRSVGGSAQWDTLSFRVRIQSSGNRVVAEGNMTFLAVARLPYVKVDLIGPGYSFGKTISLRGIFLDYYPGSTESGSVHLNSYCLPSQWLSAGRSVRGGGLNEFLSRITTLLTAEFIERTIHFLKSQDPAVVFYWSSLLYLRERTYVGMDIAESVRADLVPYRTRTENGFASLDELMRRYDRILLVPIGLAIKGPWDLEVCCVGLPFSRYHQNMINLRELVLISLPGLCTSFLAPARASPQGLTILRERATRIKGVVYVWGKSDRTRRTLARANRLGSDMAELTESYLPAYDKVADLWQELDLVPFDEDRENTETETTVAAWKRLAELPPIKYPDEPVVVTLDEDCSSWA
jgi:Histidine kinase-, DNA gyrase B-, and HSP90-like ATPase